MAGRTVSLSVELRIESFDTRWVLLADEFEVSERGVFEVKGFALCTFYALDDKIRGRR